MGGVLVLGGTPVYHLWSLLGWQVRNSLVSTGKAWQHCPHCSFIFALESPSLSYTFVINIVAITVHLHISLLFPVIFSYLSRWSSTFVPQILNSVPLEQKGLGGGERKQVVCGLGESSGGIELGSTIPKPQQRTSGYFAHLTLQKESSVTHVDLPKGTWKLIPAIKLSKLHSLLQLQEEHKNLKGI